ncbi:MAG: 50S ribosomal protein L13 [Candidatus Aenigmarchaeota archaeon]|nr:50S ribosomal protein L13 [Candidatus Aenigmarchaeota archaeon]
MIVINGYDAILGRLASKAAKELLKGEEIIIVNADKVVVSGEPTRIIQRYKEKRERGYPTKGPFFPRYPDKIVIRTIRGMLPYKTNRGKMALKRLKVYRNCPEKYKDYQEIGKKLKDLKCKYMRLEDISRKLGAKV